MQHPASILIAVGLSLAALGLLWGVVPWLGRLPGDLHWQGERGSFYFPFTTCLILSVLLSFGVWVARYFFGR
jgi:hypothetical protein